MSEEYDDGNGDDDDVGDVNNISADTKMSL